VYGEISERENAYEPFVTIKYDQPAQLVLLHDIRGGRSVVILEAVDDVRVITSSTRVSFGSLPAAVARIVMSRSVSMPTSRSFCPTGITPLSRSRILSAASFRTMSGPITTGSHVMISLICIGLAPFDKSFDESAVVQLHPGAFLLLAEAVEELG
jgi:hypothetical protein